MITIAYNNNNNNWKHLDSYYKDKFHSVDYSLTIFFQNLIFSSTDYIFGRKNIDWNISGLEKISNFKCHIQSANHLFMYQYILHYLKNKPNTKKPLKY